MGLWRIEGVVRVEGVHREEPRPVEGRMGLDEVDRLLGTPGGLMVLGLVSSVAGRGDLEVRKVEAMLWLEEL